MVQLIKPAFIFSTRRAHIDPLLRKSGGNVLSLGPVEWHSASLADTATDIHSPFSGELSMTPENAASARKKSFQLLAEESVDNKMVDVASPENLGHHNGLQPPGHARPLMSTSIQSPRISGCFRGSGRQSERHRLEFSRSCRAWSVERRRDASLLMVFPASVGIGSFARLTRSQEKHLR